VGAGGLVCEDVRCLEHARAALCACVHVCVRVVCMAFGAAVLMQRFESCGGR
jgi:hypothetical protein